MYHDPLVRTAHPAPTIRRVRRAHHNQTEHRA